MKAITRTLTRCAAALTLGVMVTHSAASSHAAGSRSLVARDFYSLACCAQYVAQIDPANQVPTVAGSHFDRGMLLGHSNFGNASATFNMARYPGYGTFTALVGITDGSVTNITERLNITGDGKLLYSHVFQQGQLAMRITIPLGKAQAITLEADSNGDSNATGLLLVDPALLPSGTAASGQSGSTPPMAGSGTTTLQLFSATAAAGGQQAALVTTAKNALVTVVIDYPNGDQAAVGPKRAGPDGHFAYSWSVPAGIHGTVHVTVDAAGAVAQATFTVS